MFSRFGRRGRPSKNVVTEKSRLINNTSLVKKPKYLTNVENKNKKLNNLSNNSSPANSDVGRKGNNLKKRKAKSKLAKGRNAQKNYYSDYTEDKYSEYHYGSDFGEDSSSDHEEVISDTELEDFDQRDDNTDSDFSLSSFSTTSTTNKKLVYPRNPTPEPIWLRNEEIPTLTLPKSSDDLLLPKPYVMQALSIYEVLRHFRSIVRLTPFRFEDFCSAIIGEEQSNLLAEIHLNLIKSILREEDSQQTHFGALDQKDSVNSVLYFLDMFTWPEVLRSYVESDSTFDASLLHILTSCEYPYTNIDNRLKILMFLTDQFLITNRVREDLVHEGGFQYEDHCRSCHKVGDLLCCETCPAVYHLECVEPPLVDVPLDDWQCSLCKSQQLMGVTDCVSEVEKSGLLSRHEPLGFDRHGRKYWFISRRIFIENEEGDCWYYSTVLQFNELLAVLDKEVYETALYREIDEFKSEICRQMEITEKLTNQFKGNRKSYLEIENENILKIQKKREEEKENEGDKVDDNPNKSEENNGETDNKDETVTEEEEEVKEDDDLDNAGDEEKDASEETTKSRKRDIVTRSKTGSLLPRTFNIDDLKKRSSLANSKGDVDKTDLPYEPTSNDNTLTKLTKTKSQLVNGSAFKLGMDTRNYVNQYTVNPLATNKAQKQEERDKKRHMSYKFSLTNAAEFKWITSLFGNRSQLVNALRQAMLHLESNIPFAFMHTNWQQLRKTWISAVNNCLLAKDFIQVIIMLQACAKPVIFASVWHDQLGHTKLCRLTALDREDRKRIEKKEKKDKEDEEEKNKLMCSHVKYSLGLKHQVFKQKGEEYRIHGQWAWIWISSARNYQFLDSRTIGLAAGPARLTVEVTDDSGPRIITVEQYTYDQLMQNTEETSNSQSNNDSKEYHKGELLSNLKKLIAKPPCSKYDGIIDVSNSLTTPGRLKYPKIAKSSKLDELLTRRIQLKTMEENSLKVKKGNNGKDERTLERNQNELSILKKQITNLKVRYSNIMDQSRQYTCYTRGCGPVNNFPCYSPLCQRRNRMRAELWNMLQRINALYKEKSTIEAQVKNQNPVEESKGDKLLTLGSIESLKNAIGRKMNLAQGDMTKTKETNSPEVENVVKTIKTEVEEPVIKSETIIPEEGVKTEPVCTTVMNDICNEVEIGTTEVITESATGEVKRIKTNRNMKVPMAKETQPAIVDNTPTRGKSAFYAKRRLMKPTVIKPDVHFGRNTKIVPIAAINADPNERITRRISADRLADTTMYSTTDTTQKIYLKKVTKEHSKKKESQQIVVKYPPTSTFRTHSKKNTLFVLQSCELKKLARQAGRKHAIGFSYLARPNVSTWIYPCPRPTFRTCWLYRTTKATTISAVGLHFRILWACLRWDDMQMKPPILDYKHHITTDTENITKEILKKRTTGRFDEITEYLIRKIVVPIGLPKKIREVTPSRVGLRKRKREEAPEKLAPQITETWVDESTLDLWEVKQFGERAEREAMQAQTQAMLRPRPLLSSVNNKYEIKSDSPLLNGKNSVHYTLLKKGLSEGTPINVKSLLSAQNSKKYTNLTTTTPSGLLKMLSKEEACNDQLLQKIAMSAPPMQFTSRSALNTLLNNLKESNGTPNKSTDKPMMPRKIFMTKGPDGKSRMISASSLSLIKVSNADGSVASGSVSPNMQRKGLQKIQISKGEDGKLQVKGLFAGQKLVQMADGKLHVMNTQNNQSSTPIALNNVVIANATPNTTPININNWIKKSDLQASTGKINSSQFSTTPILRKIMSSDTAAYCRTPAQTNMDGNSNNTRNLVQLMTTNSKGTIAATINGQQVFLRPTGQVTDGKSINVPHTSKLKAQLVMQAPVVKDEPTSDLKAVTKVQFEMKGNGISCSEALKGDLTPEQEQDLLRQHPPGTVIKCITSQVVESPQGPRIVLQGLQCSEFTPAQLQIVQQHVKMQLLKVQQEAGTEVILGPTKIYLAIQPPVNTIKKELDIEHKENIVDGIEVDVDINGRPWSLTKSARKRTAAVIEDEIRNKKMLLDEENAKMSDDDVSENRRIFDMDVSLIRKKEILKKDILKKRATLEKKLQVQVEELDDVEKVENCDEIVCKKTLEQITNAQTNVAKRGRPFKKTPVKNNEERPPPLPETPRSPLETTVKQSPKRGRQSKYSTTPNKIAEQPVNKLKQITGGRLKRTQEPTATGKIKGTPGRPRKKGRNGTATPDNGKTKKEQLLCLCRTPYDDTKFYVGCDLCNNWFHGDCVGITEDMISSLSEFICSECTHARETQELYCLCRTPYDESQFYICCDTCQDWFHGGCVGILQAEADTIDEYICPNCQKNDSINSANLKNLTSSDFDTLKKLLKQIQSHKSAWPFMEPVRPDEAPDYYKVIKHPMDLRIIEKRITEKRYKKLGDFIADVTKIFDNCRYYNPKDSSVYKCAESLEGFFVSKVKSLRDKLADGS